MRRQRTPLDPLPPASLYKIQKWFGRWIKKPLSKEEGIDCTSPSQRKSIAATIAPSPTLSSIARLEIYNQQYWWRFQKTMKDHFPALLRLYGEADFMEKLIMPYLTKKPPRFWDINLMGIDFPLFLEKSYHEEDRELILDMAKLEATLLELFFAEEAPDVKKGLSEESYIREKKRLAKTTRLFFWRYDLLSFRKALMKEEPKYWLENPFPPLEKKSSFAVIYRIDTNRILFDSVSEIEWQLLRNFEKPFSLDRLCDTIEEFSAPLEEEAEKNLSSWISSWIQKRFLIPVKRPSSL